MTSRRRPSSSALTDSIPTTYLKPVPRHYLLNLFPFTLIFGKDMKIAGAGIQLMRMHSYENLLGRSLDAIIKMRRPRVNLTWQNVSFSNPADTFVRHSSWTFWRRSIVFRKSCAKWNCAPFKTAATHYRPTNRKKRLQRAPAGVFYFRDNCGTSRSGTPCSSFATRCNNRLKCVTARESIIVEDVSFLLFNSLNNLQDMTSFGLYLNDLSLHGLGKEMVLAGWQHCSR